MKKKILASVYLMFLSVIFIINSVQYWEANKALSFLGLAFAILLLLGVLGYFINKKSLLGLNIVCMIGYSVYVLIGLSVVVMKDVSALMFGFGALVIFMTLNISVIYFTINQIRWGDSY